MQPDSEAIVYYGGAVKATQIDARHVRVHGPIVVLDGAGSQGRDFEGEAFHPGTNFGAASKAAEWIVDGMFHHGIPLASIKAAQDLAQHEFDGVRVSKSADGLELLGEVVLDLRDRYEAKVADWAQKGKLGWSTSSRPDLVRYRKSADGRRMIDRWPIVEASLTPTPMEPRTAAIPMKSLDVDASDLLSDLPEPAEAASPVTVNINLSTEAAKALASTEASPPDKPTDTPMEQDTTQATDTVDTPAADAAKSFSQDEMNAAIEAAAQKGAEAATKAFRESDTRTVKGAVDTPAVIADTSTWKYDNLSVGELATMIDVLDGAAGQARSNQPASDAAYKALARRLHSEEATKNPTYTEARQAMKAVGLDAAKANELNYSTQSGFGDEWIGVAYSSDIWEKIRFESTITQRLPQMEFPAGAESMVIPLEGADPTFYKVPQAASVADPDVGPAATVPSSKVATDNQTVTLSKLGARTLWTGEMQEDAMLPFVAQLRNQIVTAGREYLESAIIDGDTATGGTTNINDIAGTPAATDYFLVWDGFRKLALVTNTANSRSGGTLSAEDYLDTVKMLGENGKNALDESKVGLIQTAGVKWKALALEEFKTRDVNSAATIENGQIRRVYGFELIDAGNGHLVGPYRQGGLANASGKIDQDTGGNNTTGSILAVRWDQWRFYWRRRMTTEVTRIARADSYEIVCLMRAAMTYRDNEASAISYGITV